MRIRRAPIGRAPFWPPAAFGSHPGGADQLSVQQKGLTLAEIEDWGEEFLLAGENPLRARPKDAQIKKPRQKDGELVLDMDITREVMKGRHLAGRTSDEC